MDFETVFIEWWKQSYPFNPGAHAIMTHTAFAKYVLDDHQILRHMLARCPECPKCRGQFNRVILRKPTPDGDFIRRRHCLDCGHRWYTLQAAEAPIEGRTLQWSKLTRTYTINETPST